MNRSGAMNRKGQWVEREKIRYQGNEFNRGRMLHISTKEVSFSG